MTTLSLTSMIQIAVSVLIGGALLGFLIMLGIGVWYGYRLHKRGTPPWSTDTLTRLREMGPRLTRAGRQGQIGAAIAGVVVIVGSALVGSRNGIQIGTLMMIAGGALGALVVVIGALVRQLSTRLARA